MKKIYYIPLLLFLFFSFLSCTLSPEEPEGKDPVEEIGEEQPADEIDVDQPPEEIGEEPPEDDIDKDQPEEPQQPQQPQEPQQPEQNISLQLVDIAEDMVGIDLMNTVPVRGVQFTIEGVAIADVLTTSRSEDFMASFNEESGRVLIVSLAGDEILPGGGLIAEILFDGNGLARLSEIIIAE
jgi:hypothetical protein